MQTQLSSWTSQTWSGCRNACSRPAPSEPFNREKSNEKDPIKEPVCRHRLPAQFGPGAWAATVFSYQGQIDQNGQPYTGTVNLELELYSGPVAGTQIGTTISLSNHPDQSGLFHAELDFGPVFDGSPRYLLVRVNGSELTPRQAVQAAPLALFALTGNEGPEGPVGPAGPQGSQGPPGAPGDSHWQISGSDTYYDAGRVGIGVSNPATNLQVAGSAIFGASGNSAGSSSNFVAGGSVSLPNAATSQYTAVVGGWDNTASNWNSFVGGGMRNEVGGRFSFVAAGSDNSISGWYSFIGAGNNNKVIGNHSFAAGRFAKVLHIGSFVWGDSQTSDFATTGDNQFMVCASGGTELCLNGAGLISSCMSSSRRYKDEVMDLENAGALVAGLRAVTFRWKESGMNDIGLIAEEVAEIEPRLATYDGDGAIEGVNYRHLTAVLDRQGRLLAELQAAMEELK